MLAFSNDYYGIIFRATQSVELFCAYEESVCIRPYSSNSLREYIFPVRERFYRVMAEIGLNHKPKRKLNGITKADREASKSDDLIKRDFAAEKPLENAHYRYD